MDGGGTVRLIKVYMPRRYNFSSWSCTYLANWPRPDVDDSQIPFGWYGLILGPPISPFIKPLLDSTISFTNSAAYLARDDLERKIFSGSFESFSLVTTDD